MSVHSVEVEVPDDRPFDRQDNWFQSYVGSIIEPVVRLHNVSRFWFTRYGAIGHGKYTLFRFETDGVPAILSSLASELGKFGMHIRKDESYDVADDIGRGQDSRFLGTNARHQSPAQRGDVAFTFLHASACLMLDCLVGPDSAGYFSLESETQSGFSRESSLEQFHHLFCNMTCVPTYVAIGFPPDSAEPIPITYEELKKLSQRPGWQTGATRKAHF